VFDDGELLMKAVDNPDPEADPCAAFAQPDYYCSELRNNQAGRPATGTTGIGGAVYVGHGAAAEVVRTALVGNRSQQDAAHLYIAPGARADVQGSLVADAIVDADWPVSRGVMNEGRLSSRFSTYGGDGTTVVYGVGSQGEFFGNVVFPDGGVGGGLSVLPLLIQPLSLLPAYNTGTLSGSLFSTTNVDPLFTTTSRGYYRLGGGSPAVDQGSYPGVTPLLDLDLCSRPSGLDYDHGALETGTCP
jgi:hypothetical protein